MMDHRTVITNKILINLVKHHVDQTIIDETRNLLEIELSKCEVYPRCTELATIDLSPFEYLKQFLDVKQIEGKSDGTIERYKYEISQLLFYFHKPLTEYTTNDLRNYLDYRKRNGKMKKVLSNRTLDGMRAIYSAFFAWLTSENIIKSNPCLALHKIKYLKAVKTSFSQIDLQRLRESCKTIRDTAMVDWLISTGCRVSEVANTKLSMIDWNTRSCIVIGKGNKERTVYFDDITAMHLQMYLNTMEDSVDALFIGRNGDPLTKSGIQQAIKKIGNSANVASTHCHRFRHTLATSLSDKMPIVDVAQILGHSNISTTQVYCHANQDTIMSNYRRIMA
jgi:site-specific recombinase XerD